MEADETTREQILEILTDLFDAFRDRNLRRVMALTAPDLVVVRLGEEGILSEPNAIMDAFQRDWEGLDSISITINSAGVYTSDSTAWVAAECLLHAVAGNERRIVPVRITAVLVQKGTQWLISLYHASVALRPGILASAAPA